MIHAAQKVNRTLLTEPESKEMLGAYAIPTVKTLIATSAKEAVQAAASLGSTVVLKLYSEKVTHKSDVGGVKLNLRTEDEVRRAYYDIEKGVREIPGAFLGVVVEPMVQTDGYELILGSSIDPQFGPVLLFGSGGRLVEVQKDYALGLPPLNGTLARRLMEQTADIHRPEGRSRPSCSRPGETRKSARPIQSPCRRTILDQGDRY